STRGSTRKADTVARGNRPALTGPVAPVALATRRRRRPSATRRLLASLGAIVAVAASLLVPMAAPAAAAPGNPGVPGDPIVVFQEGFENDPTDPQMVTSYTGGAPLAMTYAADAGWVTGCNGHVMRADHETVPGDYACGQGSWDIQRGMAAALG